jgi:5'-3' exonuclease
MILVDFSQLCHAAVHVLRDEILRSREDPQEISNILRHGILSQFRSIRGSGRFQEYGKEVVVCCDSRVGYWRHDIFPHYKANRKERDEEDLMPWEHITPFFHQIREDIKEHFPYKVIEIPKLEADDIGAILVEDVANKNMIQVGLEEDAELALIYGRDKDSKQLLKYRNVRQWDPFQQKYVQLEEPARKFLKRLIITGDRGDGICNIFSPNDSLVKKVRQKPATEKKVSKLLEAEDIFEACENDEQRQRLMENTRLISFDCIPKKFRPLVVQAYQEKPKGTKLTAYHYLVKHDCKILADDAERF